jgi:hypothetical protein
MRSSRLFARGGPSNVETRLDVFNELQQVPGEELDMIHLNRPPRRMLTRERGSYSIYLSMDNAVPDGSDLLLGR